MLPVASPELELVLAQVICRSPGALSRLRAVDPQLVYEAAETQGVTSLLHQALCTVPDASPTLMTALQHRMLSLAVVDVISEQALTEILETLHRSGIGVLLMKGAHLAYCHYPGPHLRPRLDSDLLVDPAAKDRAIEVLLNNGYEVKAEQQDGDLLMHQRVFVRRLGTTPTVVDLHWRALNPRVFANSFQYQDLAQSSVAVPALGPFARGLSPVHALALACVHRLAHHAGEDLLIWLYDIHLLASSIEPSQWEQFVSTADRYGLGAFCRDSLQVAIRTFGTPVPAGLLDDRRLNAAPHDGRSAYLKPQSRFAAIVGDVRAVAGWRNRLRLLHQYVFPSPAYMRAVYANGRRLPLPLLYLIRAVRGLMK